MADGDDGTTLRLRRKDRALAGSLVIPLLVADNQGPSRSLLFGASPRGQTLVPKSI